MLPLTILGLAKHIPDIVKLFDRKRGEDAEKAIGKVESIAETLTGKTDEEAVAAINADPQLAFEFKKQVMADKHVKTQLYLEDRQDARDMYKTNGGQADKIADRIFGRNLPYVFLLLVIQVGVIIHLEDKPAVIAIICNAIGFVVGQLLNERQQVTGFYFGSSMGSKMKQMVAPKKDGKS